MNRVRRISRIRRVILFWAAAALIAALEAVLTANWLVGKTSARIYSSVNDIPPCEVGMVLGTSEYSNGRPSPVLAGRLQAAADLYHAGKVKMLVVSGANRPEEFYDEIAAMTQALIALGVPEDAIIGDSKGLRTLDSILRMRDVFGCDGFITISQRGHLERALYLADHHGVSTIGFEAGIPSGLYPDEWLGSAIRVPLSNVKAILDIAIGRRAKYPAER
ncbi:MAG: YdcF family protein [Lentisphaeria bacterium]|nr:YdcF family protein [Lentisphaeria bacterium]